MKIWYLTSEFPPDFGGGISMYIDNIANLMARKGHIVKVIVRDQYESKIENKSNNLSIIRFKHMEGEYYKSLGYWTALAYQYMEICTCIIQETNEKPDIIEIPDYNAIGYYILLKRWLGESIFQDIKIVLHIHTPTFELARINQTPRFKFPTYWIGQMEKFCLNAADAIVAQSEFLYNNIRQEIKKEKYYEIIPLPYELKSTTKWEYKEAFDADLLYLGRLEYRKGVLRLLKCVSKMWDCGKTFKLRMVGGDTYFNPQKRTIGEIIRSKYSKWIEKGYLILNNSVPPDELPEIIANARCTIIPSLYENYPYNCIIPMSHGAPVLVSKSGGQSEMVGIDGKNGFIFDWDKPGDLERNISEILKYDRDKLVSISKNCLDRIVSLTDYENNYNLRYNFYENVKKQLIDDNNFPVSITIPEKNVDKLIETNVEKSLLSIVIPFYNLGDYIEETLLSAMEIDYSSFEVIIINDGSNDLKSLQVLESIRNRNYQNLRIIDIENQGLANARNVGAINAKGEYIAFLDADDLIDKSFYSRAIHVLEKYSNISFVYSWVQYFEGGNGMWPTFSTEFPYILGMNMLTAFVVVRKQDFISFGMNKVEMEYGMEDYEGWISMCENGCSGVSIPEPLVKYRVRSNSMSRQFNRDMVIYLMDRLSEHHRELYNKYGVQLYNLFVANGPGYLWNNPTFGYPEIGFVVKEDPKPTSETVEVSDYNSEKFELIRIANSRLGSKIIKLFFKCKFNKFFI